MMILRRAIVLIAIISQLTFSINSYATGIPVFDGGNFSQNVITSIKAVAGEIQRAQQIANQVEQIRNQAKNLQNLDFSAIQSLAGLTGIELGDYQQYITALQTARGTLGDMQTMITRRVDERKRLGLSWSDYIIQERGSLARQVSERVAILNLEKKTLKKVETDFGDIRRWQAKITSTVGANESMGLMNAQLNKLLTQQAKFLEQVTLSNNERSIEQVEKNAEKTANLDYYEQRMAREKERIRIQQQQINDLKR